MLQYLYRFVSNKLPICFSSLKNNDFEKCIYEKKRRSRFILELPAVQSRLKSLIKNNEFSSLPLSLFY